LNPDSGELKALVQKITDLPTLPSMMATITRLMQDPRTSAEELGRAISSDPALVSKVLKLVNSAFYGFPGRIGTITQAIVILGFSTIRNVVLTTSVLKAFGKGATAGVDVGRFWEHSLLTGAIARSLAMQRGAHFTEETFIAGLLHDMGRIVLSQKLPAEFEKVIQTKLKAGLPQLEAEQRALHLTHGDIGGWLARKWNLPLPFVEVMRLHHFPARVLEGDLSDQPDTVHLVYMVHAADALAKGMRDGALQEGSLAAVDPRVRSELKLEAAGWDRFRAKAEEEIGKARAFLEIL
jgi:HD-like signal output (HDOD) protein